MTVKAIDPFSPIQQYKISDKQVIIQESKNIQDKVTKVFEKQVPEAIQQKQALTESEKEYYIGQIVEQKHVSKEVAEAEYNFFS